MKYTIDAELVMRIVAAYLQVSPYTLNPKRADEALQTLRELFEPERKLTMLDWVEQNTELAKELVRKPCKNPSCDWCSWMKHSKRKP